jgi:hypothetical protein
MARIPSLFVSRRPSGRVDDRLISLLLDDATRPFQSGSVPANSQFPGDQMIAGRDVDDPAGMRIQSRLDAFVIRGGRL